MNLRRFYGANVLAVSRQGHRLKDRLSGIRLQSGDVLLIQGDTENLGTVLERLGCLPLAKRSLRIDKPTRVVTAVLIFLGVVLLSALGTLPVQVAFTAGAVLMVLCGIINPRELYESVDWPLIVLLGAFIPVGEAMQNAGITRSIADAFLPVAGQLPHVVSLGVVLTGTLLLSNVINHTAAAVIMAPIAISIAEGFGALGRSISDGSCGGGFIAVSYPDRSSGQHSGYGARRLRIRRLLASGFTSKLAGGGTDSVSD